MKAILKYRLSALEKIPFCDIKVFGDSSEVLTMEFGSGDTFAEAKEAAISRIRDALSRRRDPSLEIPPPEEIELDIRS